MRVGAQDVGLEAYFASRALSSTAKVFSPGARTSARSSIALCGASGAAAQPTRALRGLQNRVDCEHPSRVQVLWRWLAGTWAALGAAPSAWWQPRASGMRD